MAKNIIPFLDIHKFRRIKGLPGHPDVKTKGIYTNTGSLGMGISKAKGFLLANNFKKKRKVIVLTGDGELQEGQFWESLMSIPKNISKNLIIIVDNNKYQSDLTIQDTSSLGNLKKIINLSHLILKHSPVMEIILMILKRPLTKLKILIHLKR